MTRRSSRLARGRGGACRGRVSARRCRRVIRERLHRQAERAGARASIHRAQHRVHAAGVRSQPDRGAAVSGRGDGRGGGSRRQPRRRCRTSGSGTGASCRTRCGSCRRSAPTTTSRTSTSIATTIDGAPRQVMLATRELNVDKLPGEQPQLDQREADLHARLRRHDELRQRLHAGRAAAAAAQATCRCRARRRASR